MLARGKCYGLAGKVLRGGGEGKGNDVHSADERIREDGLISGPNGSLLTNAKSHTT